MNYLYLVSWFVSGIAGYWFFYFNVYGIRDASLTTKPKLRDFTVGNLVNMVLTSFTGWVILLFISLFVVAKFFSTDKLMEKRIVDLFKRNKQENKQ